MQSGLDDFGDGKKPSQSDLERKSIPDDAPRANVLAYQRMPDDAEPYWTWSCPWCCAPPSNFRQNDIGWTGCGNCSAALPFDDDGYPVDWWAEGDKIII